LTGHLISEKNLNNFKFSDEEAVYDPQPYEPYTSLMFQLARKHARNQRNAPLTAGPKGDIKTAKAEKTEMQRQQALQKRGNALPLDDIFTSAKIRQLTSELAETIEKIPSRESIYFSLGFDTARRLMSIFQAHSCDGQQSNERTSLL
jgi:hypothetical protein